MRIGIEIQRLYRHHKHGIEVFALELIKGLQQLDLDNEYFVFVRNGLDNQCFKESKNFRVIEFDSCSFGDWEQFLLPRKCKEYEIDLLHLTGNTAPVFIDVPYVQTVHDIIYMDKLGWGGTSYQILGNFYRRFVVPITVKKASRVVTVSEFEQNRINKRLGVSKVTTVYNGIGHLYRKHYSDIELRRLKEKYLLPDDFVLFLGNTAPRKNARRALNAFVQVATKGDGTIKLVAPALNSEIVNQYINIKDSDLFNFPGFIDNEDLPMLYQAAKLLLFPSLSEGFGLPIIEAMAMSCPVITSNTTSMPEISGGAALLVDPENQADIENKLEQLLFDEKQRQQCILLGKERVNLFSWDNAAKSYLNIYQEVLNLSESNKN